MGEPVKVTDNDFQQKVIDSDKPVLVDFWAEWCGPCKMVAPVVEDIAEEYEEQIKVCKLDVDDNQATASQYGVMSIPTLIYFENGEEKDKIVGYQPKENIVNKLNLE